MIGFLLATTMGSTGAVSVGTPQQCALITATGALVAFSIFDKSNAGVLVPSRGSAWPAEALRIQKSAVSTYQLVKDEDRLMIAVAPGRDGVSEIELTRSTGKAEALPAAVGYCVDGDSPGEHNEREVAKSDIIAPAFAHENWMEGCPTISDTGRRSLIALRPAVGDGPGILESRASGFWARDVPITLAESTSSNMRGFIRYSQILKSSDGSVAGMVDSYRTPERASQFDLVRTIRFDRLGSSVASFARSICGANVMTRIVYERVL